MSYKKRYANSTNEFYFAWRGKPKEKYPDRKFKSRIKKYSEEELRQKAREQRQKEWKAEKIKRYAELQLKLKQQGSNIPGKDYYALNNLSWIK